MSSREHPEAAMSSREHPEAARSSQEQPGAVRSSQKQPEAARTARQDQPRTPQRWRFGVRMSSTYDKSGRRAHMIVAKKSKVNTTHGNTKPLTAKVTIRHWNGKRAS
jgi:hypothetical protein